MSTATACSCCLHNLISMTTYRVCCCFRRRFRPGSTEPPKAIKEVFKKYAEGGVLMEADEIRLFMEEVQGDATATREAALAVIEAAREHQHLKILHSRGLSLDVFYRSYLFSDDNAALPATGVYQDMSAPLSHYFIYTGHNSYLTGNQLSSESSDVPIINALNRGVRVIELDVWPNATNDDVDVVHGRTLTAPVELIRCLISIKEFAFAASEYPVIITLEDHLTPDLQAKVAEMLIQTFGSMLFTSANSSSLEKFPSPEELKGRILVSTKPPKEYLSIKSVREKDQQGDEGEALGGEESDSEAQSEEANDKLRPRPSAERDDEEEDEEEEDEEEEDADQVEEISHRGEATEYKNLIAIPAKKRKSDLAEALKVDPGGVSRLSLSEVALEKAALFNAAQLIRFTQSNLLRIFPKSSRVTSSNYKPLLAWMHGAQMVALNMQGHGKALWLMQGMFRANGGCGYVKKPDILLNDDQIFDPKDTLPVKKTLKVRVYTGDGWRFDFSKHHFDTYSPPDFYTRVGIAGVPADTVMKRTRTILDNWTPIWDEELEFPLTVPELALLRVEVYEHDISGKDDFAGQTCLPVWELRTGIRSVRLCSHKGETLPSVKLLMRFDFV